MLKHVNSDLRSKCHINNLIFRCLCIFITRWSDNLQLLTLSNNSFFYSLSSPNENEFFGKGQLSLNVFWSRRSKYSYCVANISLCKKASYTRQSANLICIILIVLVVGKLTWANSPCCPNQLVWPMQKPLILKPRLSQVCIRQNLCSYNLLGFCILREYFLFSFVFTFMRTHWMYGISGVEEKLNTLFYNPLRNP